MSCPNPLRVTLLAALLLATPIAIRGQTAAPGVELTFLGNEGFLLSGRGRKVLVDALIPDAPSPYVDQSPALRRKLTHGEAPFDRIDLVLATHVHADHFGAATVAAHLRRNPRAVFVGTPQCVTALRDLAPDLANLPSRFKAPDPRPGKRIALPELGLEVLNLHHGRNRPLIRNHAYLVHIAGMRVLHLGDSEAGREELRATGLRADAVDLCLTPSWYLDAAPWRGALEIGIKPRHLVVMHLAPRWSSETKTPHQRQSRARVARIRKSHPTAVIFAKELETRTFTAPAR